MLLQGFLNPCARKYFSIGGSLSPKKCHYSFQISYLDNVTYAQLTLPSPRSYARQGHGHGLPPHPANGRQHLQNFSSSPSASPTPDRVVYSQIDPHLTSALHSRFHPANNCRIILNPQEKMSPTRGMSLYPASNSRHEEESGSWAPLLSAHQQESNL